MKINKKFAVSALISITSFLISANSFAKPDAIKFWIAPNETQEAYWSEVVKEWNDSKLGLPVEMGTIPATGSSEEAIMNAISAGTQPDISENIFSGFSAQLTELDQIENLSQYTGFTELVQSRQMGEIMENWQFENNNYVFPLYINPVVYWWRADLLKEYGFDDVPKSYDDIYKLSEAYSQKNKRYAMQVAAGNNWWDRWFDFISLYYAQSNGAPYLAQSSGASFDNQAALDALTFVETMFKNNWATYEFSESEPLASGEVIGVVRGPWDIARFKTQYPEILKQIKIGSILTKDGRENPNTFGDGKGLVIFSQSEVKEEAWEFMKWALSQEKFDKRWLELTGMPPARGDLNTNPIFIEFFEQNPLIAEYAKRVSKAVPPAFTTQTVELQRAMTDMIERIIFNGQNAKDSLAEFEEAKNSL